MTSYERFSRAAIAAASFFIASACGQSGVYSSSVPQSDLPNLGTPDAGGAVVKARAILALAPGADGRLAVSANQPISVTIAANVTMSLSNQDWALPTFANDLLDFGFLEVTALSDNNVKVCGQNGNQRCGTALFRAYTIGKPGAGVWNAADGYGAPLFAGLTGSIPGTVGLNAAGAVVLQSMTIAAPKNVVKLSDFTAKPRYGVKADFTEAGAGAYATTLVIEYALAP